MKGCLGVIVGNRGVFPGSLAEEGRREVVDILKRQGIEVVLPGIIIMALTLINLCFFTAAIFLRLC